MNKTYRSVFNASTGTWVAAPETAKGRAKSSRRVIACATLCVAAAVGMGSAHAFTPIGDNATGTYPDLIIGDNAKGISIPTYFWIVPDTDPAGNPVPSVGSTIVGNNANANEHAGVTLFGDHAYATGNGAVALGPNASAGTVATAVGNDSRAAGRWSLAFGARSYAEGDESTALGGLSRATGTYSNAVGVYSNASGYGSFSGGYASAAGWGGIAIGYGSAQTADMGIALGAYSNASGISSVALGYGARTGAANAIALGKQAQALGDQSISIGTGNAVTGNNSGAIGDPNTIAGAGSYALGNDNNIDADNAFVVGNNVSVPAGLNGAVVLGNNSTVSAATPTPGVTLNGVAYAFAGGSPAAGDVVSVGSVAAPRQVQNVAAGRISATSTDAINGSQLYATNQAIETLDQGAVKYDRNADGTVNYNSVTMGGDTYDPVTRTGGTRITNVARGVADSDAVNVSQLNEVKADVTTISDTVENFAGDQSTTYTEENGRGIRYVRTNDTGLPQADAFAKGQASTAVGYNAQASGDSAVAMGHDSSAAGTDAVAIGHNSVATNAGDVALGSGSVTAAAVATTGVTIAGKDYTFAGTAPTSTVSVGDVGAERTITNVAAGRISATSTDAVNGSQLYATNQAIEQIASNITTLDQGAVKYDTNADGTVNYNSVTMGGDTYNAVTRTGGTRITNVARGVNDSDAVNMSQLNETNAVINNFAGDQSSTYTDQNGRGIRYVRTNDTGLPQADAYAQGQGSTAVGYGATATGDSALALGRNAVASDANSVALGAGSVTSAAVATTSGVVGGTTYQFAGGSPASTVSVGSAGNERTVTNVAAGRINADSTDAVNGSQLYATNQKVDENMQDIANLNQQVGSNTQSINNLNNRIDGVQRAANAGTASAMALAGLPQAVLPGKGMVALAGSTYSGQSALALGVSALSDSGKWVFKGGVTTNSRGNVGATVGAGFHW